MEKKVNIEGNILAIAAYKPKAGQAAALMQLVKQHLPTLRELGFATSRQNYIANAQDGTILEIFEWESANTIQAAHEHPAVTAIWEKMTLIADFNPINSLSELRGPFADFTIVK